MFGAIGLTAVAEGNEEQAQTAMMVELGCKAGQGFLYGRPGPLDATTVEPVSAGWM
jgi:EAL domain-containing protein (putative c-di-GMP-specific phosphodiesterase class I)